MTYPFLSVAHDGIMTAPVFTRCDAAVAFDSNEGHRRLLTGHPDSSSLLQLRRRELVKGLRARLAPSQAMSASLPS